MNYTVEIRAHTVIALGDKLKYLNVNVQLSGALTESKPATLSKPNVQYTCKLGPVQGKNANYLVTAQVN